MSETFYPTYGAEEEYSFRHLHVFGSDGAFTQQEVITTIAAHRKQRGIITANTVAPQKLDSTGGALSRDGQRMEFGTPEYLTIEELVARKQDEERRLVEVADDHMRVHKSCRGVGVDMRVIDARGNAAGPQYNYGYPEEVGDVTEYQSSLKPFLHNYLLANGLFGGVGLMSDDGVFFWQKLAAKKDLYLEAHHTGIFLVKDEEDGVRIESRGPDRNIAPDALRREIGGTAIALALARAGRTNKFVSRMTSASSSLDFLSEVLALNRVLVNDEDGFMLTPRQRDVINFLIDVDTAFMEDMAGYDPPEELVDIAEKRIKYAEDFLAVGDRKLPLEKLVSRSDFAMKLFIVQRHIKRDRKGGIKRSATDLQAQKDDMAYSAIQVTPGTNGPKVKRPGYAFNLRDRGQFADPVAPELVANARTAPVNTRAGLRAWLLENFVVTDLRWDSARLRRVDGESITIPFDARTIEVPPEYAFDLAHAERRPKS